jgi:hypothetical protein
MLKASLAAEYHTTRTLVMKNAPRLPLSLLRFHTPLTWRQRGRGSRRDARPLRQPRLLSMPAVAHILGLALVIDGPWEAGGSFFALPIPACFGLNRAASHAVRRCRRTLLYACSLGRRRSSPSDTMAPAWTHRMEKGSTRKVARCPQTARGTAAGPASAPHHRSQRRLLFARRAPPMRTHAPLSFSSRYSRLASYAWLTPLHRRRGRGRGVGGALR